MDKIVNKYLLVEDNFTPEMHLRQPEFTYTAYRPFKKAKKKYKNLKKQEIHDIFIKTNQIKLHFNMTRLMDILKIWLEEQLLTWVIPLKDKKGATITNSFEKILKEFNRKPKKIWVDKGSIFYNRSMKSW